MNANPNIMLLRNLTASAPLSPHFFCLDLSTGIWEGVTDPQPKTHISGYGSTLIKSSDGRWIKKLLAVYLRNDAWMIFDSEQEVALAGSVAKWELENFGRAALTLQCSAANETITYFRPWFRLWFESGWTLNDIDIAHLIVQCIDGKEVLPRLERALAVANSEFGFKTRESV